MNCPKCNSLQLNVISTREHEEGIRRRRGCLVCGFRFTTVEIGMKEYKGCKRLQEKASLLQTLLRRMQGVLDEVSAEGMTLQRRKEDSYEQNDTHAIH